MKHLAMTVLAVLAASAFGEDRRIDPSRLVVMTLNAEFLWDGREPEEGQVGFMWRGAPDEADEHLEEIADIIIAHNPDIVNLCEVENLDALERLNTEFLAGMGYAAYLEKGRDTYTGQDVGLLTRIDPEGGSIVHDRRTGRSGATTKSVSKNYVARFDVGGRKIGVVGLHFLARPSSEDRRPGRQAQADAVRQMAVELADAGYDVIVLGDFNDYDGDPDCLDIEGNEPISTVLAQIRGMRPANTGDDLENAASLLPQAARYTAHRDRNRNDRVDAPREFSAIDHLLVDQDLWGLVEWADIPHTYDPLQVSDHYPVVVSLRLDNSGGGNGSVPPLRITAVYPNPPTQERENESIRFEVTGTSPMSVNGWRVIDKADTEWELTGTHGPGAFEFTRSGQPMGLNNGGDRLQLVKPDGTVVQTVVYGKTLDGEWVHVD